MCLIHIIHIYEISIFYRKGILLLESFYILKSILNKNQELNIGCIKSIKKFQ